MWKRKRNASQPQQTEGEGTAKPMFKKGKGNGGTIDETSMSLQQGIGTNPNDTIKTVYKSPKESFTKLLLELQSKDTVVTK
ncbi:MAG: hypothetical protein M1840_003511 [Geoglossum simile]|nr:MAG: hypothetical protein M1840_003511 [Geoglossum simile]